MGRQKKHHYPFFERKIRGYAIDRALDLDKYNQWHYRLTDGGYTTLDMWDTGKYYILETNYSEIAPGTVERQGETGHMPMHKLRPFLDKIFYPTSKEDI